MYAGNIHESSIAGGLVDVYNVLITVSQKLIKLFHSLKLLHP